MTPLMVAADRTREDVVEFLSAQSFVLYEEQIDAYELLGASYANDKDNYSPAAAYRNLKKGMDLRFRDRDNPIEKRLASPIPAYDNWIEARSPEELLTRAVSVFYDDAFYMS